MTTRTGGCFCGAIRYEVEGDPMMQIACHCRACQYAAGGSPTLAMLFPRSNLKVLKGQPRTWWAETDTGNKVGRSFCEACGTHVFSEPTVSELAVIKVGSLDDPSDFKPQLDIWMKTAQPWHLPHEGAMQFEGNPG
ncbi:MAG TPA: GFA family protein [Caulobacteraceae bacterium]|nr:GFA family protein [Caulobacteraceae bacterium]